MALDPGAISFISIASILLIVSVIANFLVIFTVTGSQKKLRTTTGALICNLAVSDIVLGGILLPQNVHDISHTHEYDEGAFTCKIVTALPVFCILIAIYTLVLMSWERYQAIVNMHSSISTRKLCLLLTTVWVGALICCLPTFFEYKTYYKYEAVYSHHSVQHYLSENQTFCPDADLLQEFEIKDQTNDTDTTQKESGTTFVLWSPSLVEAYYLKDVKDLSELNVATDNCASHFYVNATTVTTSLRCGSTSSQIAGWLSGLFLLMVAYVIPSVAIWVNYGRVIHFIVRFAKERKIKKVEQNQFAIFKKRVKIVKMLVIVAALFELCWLPYFAILIYVKITGDDDSENLDGAANLARLALSVFSVSYNVYLYLIYNSTFRRSFISLITKCCPKKNTVHPLETIDNTVNNRTGGLEGQS